jgi:serine/threonine protein phosphatase 1
VFLVVRITPGGALRAPGKRRGKVVEGLTYAIGDVHGCHHLLLKLLQGIARHAAGRPHRLVFLGDYIDRGPDSAAVVATVRELEERSPATVTCLMGNHEAMMLTAAADPSAVPWWLANGGYATLRSFGAANVGELPAEVLDWASRLPTSWEDDRRCFVHAGLDPRRPLADQDDFDRLWIREPFLSADHDFGKHVVHGHTPLATASPDERRHRTNLDTAAVFGGALTAGVFASRRDQAEEYLRVLAWLS